MAILLCFSNQTSTLLCGFAAMDSLIDTFVLLFAFAGLFVLGIVMAVVALYRRRFRSKGSKPISIF